MKKIILVLMACFALTAAASAQLFGKTPKNENEQEKGQQFRVAVYDIPRTDSLYVGIIPDTMRVVSAYRLSGEDVLMLSSRTQYEEIKNKMDSLSNLPKITGVTRGQSYIVVYLGKLSYLTKRQINKLPPDKRLVAEAFNQKQKYLYISLGQDILYGKMQPDGRIKTDLNFSLNPYVGPYEKPVPEVKPAAPENIEKVPPANQQQQQQECCKPLTDFRKQN